MSYYQFTQARFHCDICHTEVEGERYIGLGAPSTLPDGWTKIGQSGSDLADCCSHACVRTWLERAHLQAARRRRVVA